MLDTVMLLPTGPDLSFSPQIGRFLEEVFEDKALAFQSLHFEVGSTQEIHQDTAYVVVDHEPTKLIASWIALEDIEPGGGEITKPGRTRRSLVTHYCPKALMPHHVGFIPEEWRRQTEVRGGHAFISSIFPPQLFAAYTSGIDL